MHHGWENAETLSVALMMKGMQRQAHEGYRLEDVWIVHSRLLIRRRQLLQF